MLYASVYIGGMMLNAVCYCLHRWYDVTMQYAIVYIGGMMLQCCMLVFTYVV